MSADRKSEPTSAATTRSSTDDAPPTYTPRLQSYVSAASEHESGVREINPSTIPSDLGPRKVYSTYPIYLNHNHMLPQKSAIVKHMDGAIPSYILDFHKRSDPEMILRKGSSTSSPVVGTANFGKPFGASTLYLSYDRVASIGLIDTPATRAQKLRIFKVSIENATPSQHPSALFWKVLSKDYGETKWGCRSWELSDNTGQIYAVLNTSVHKSTKKLGRLHLLEQLNEEFVELLLGSVMCIWKSEKDVVKGKWNALLGNPASVGALGVAAGTAGGGVGGAC